MRLKNEHCSALRPFSLETRLAVILAWETADTIRKAFNLNLLKTSNIWLLVNKAKSLKLNVTGRGS